VLDENGNPVPDAEITFGWSELPTQARHVRASAKSDAMGVFSLHGKRGPSLDVSVSKEGYYASHGGKQGFSYFLGYSPDPHNPAVFKLRKKGQGEELISSKRGGWPDLTVPLPRDGTPVQVDLLQGKAGSSGDLEISQVKPDWRQATEWSLSLRMLDGGLIEHNEEFPFLAPETGYQPVVELHFRKGDTNWTTQVVKNYYIAFGQPRKYGWLQVRSNISQEANFIKYAVNPSGSRNLEPVKAPNPFE
jgi:hypothetical protein